MWVNMEEKENQSGAQPAGAEDQGRGLHRCAARKMGLSQPQLMERRISCNSFHTFENIHEALALLKWNP